MSTPLEDMQAGLDSACMATLGDSLRYQVDGEGMEDRLGFVEYGDEVADTGQGTAIGQAMTVEMLITDLPSKPGSRDRIELPKRPGKIYRPKNVVMSDDGDHWRFELVQADA